jgi:hypothetical protein
MFDNDRIIEVVGVDVVTPLIALFLSAYPLMLLKDLDKVRERFRPCKFSSSVQLPKGCNTKLLSPQTAAQLECAEGVSMTMDIAKVGSMAVSDPGITHGIMGNCKQLNRAQVRTGAKGGLTDLAVYMLGQTQQRGRYGATVAADSEATVAQVVMDNVLGMAHIAIIISNITNRLDAKTAAAAGDAPVA